MTAAIARAFNEREHLMIEAGTGVGKSLAYLVPSILWAWTNDTPVIVSTATRNLQSQLIHSDIPRALGILGADAANFRVALLKGRANYLCLRSVGEFFAPGFWTMSAEEQVLMPAFIDWLQRTPDGDLDDYEGLPRGLLTCPGEECGGQCAFHRADRSIECKFAECHAAGERITGKQTACGNERKCDRQIECCTFLFSIRRSEIHKGAALRMTESAGKKCGFDPVAALFDRGIRESDNGYKRFLSVSGGIDFHLNGECIDSRDAG